MQLLYFAWIRERTGVAEEQFVLPEGVADVGGLVEHLKSRGGGYEAAFEACHFLIDWLKTKAPFWKAEATSEGDKWVAAKDSDDAAADRWRKS